MLYPEPLSFFKLSKAACSSSCKILISSKEQILNEKMKALTELKNQVASLSIEMSEKVLKSELSDAAKQKEFVSKSLKQSELN